MCRLHTFVADKYMLDNIGYTCRVDYAYIGYMLLRHTLNVFAGYVCKLYILIVIRLNMLYMFTDYTLLENRSLTL